MLQQYKSGFQKKRWTPWPSISLLRILRVAIVSEILVQQHFCTPLPLQTFEGSTIELSGQIIDKNTLTQAMLLHPNILGFVRNSSHNRLKRFQRLKICVRVVHVRAVMHVAQDCVGNTHLVGESVTEIFKKNDVKNFLVRDLRGPTKWVDTVTSHLGWETTSQPISGSTLSSEKTMEAWQ